MFVARRALYSPHLAIRQFATSPARLAVTPRVPYTKPAPTATKTVARAAASTAGRVIVDEPPDEVDIDSLMDDVRSPTGASSNAAGAMTTFAGGESMPDAPPDPNSTDWYTSYHGLSTQPFSKETAEILMAPIDPMDVEIKPGEVVDLLGM
jgi:hypothetical protein